MSNYKGGAPSHILFTEETEEYIIRSFYDSGRGYSSGPSRVRQSGKLQGYSYVAGPFWSGGSARDLLDLADWIIATGKEDFLYSGCEVVSLSFYCNLENLQDCEKRIDTCGKEHDASCKGGRMQKIWGKCKRFDSLMGKLQDILNHKGYKVYKDWQDFGLSSQKMVWWLKLKR